MCFNANHNAAHQQHDSADSLRDLRLIVADAAIKIKY